ncbi:hypothetical protein JOE52_007163 [Bradyrhizobium canariense]|nr:hypothetical protein [Bradyrhizobium canariense]MBM7488181.1 hypothetical protein [Bradyrhizobium canariense]
MKTDIACIGNPLMYRPLKGTVAGLNVLQDHGLSGDTWVRGCMALQAHYRQHDLRRCS